ncbi:hypothetical protein CVM50_09315 [Pseudooceanicola marinus]|nr:hypothetical protein CVM50_09315 [Pseudooceanicola marinus]
MIEASGVTMARQVGQWRSCGSHSRAPAIRVRARMERVRGLGLLRRMVIRAYDLGPAEARGPGVAPGACPRNAKRARHWRALPYITWREA